MPVLATCAGVILLARRVHRTGAALPRAARRGGGAQRLRAAARLGGRHAPGRGRRAGHTDARGRVHPGSAAGVNGQGGTPPGLARPGPGAGGAGEHPRRHLPPRAVGTLPGRGPLRRPRAGQVVEDSPVPIRGHDTVAYEAIACLDPSEKQEQVATGMPVLPVRSDRCHPDAAPPRGAGSASLPARRAAPRGSSA